MRSPGTVDLSAVGREEITRTNEREDVSRCILDDDSRGVIARTTGRSPASVPTIVAGPVMCSPSKIAVVFAASAKSSTLCGTPACLFSNVIVKGSPAGT